MYQDQAVTDPLNRGQFPPLPSGSLRGLEDRNDCPGCVAATAPPSFPSCAQLGASRRVCRGAILARASRASACIVKWKPGELVTTSRSWSDLFRDHPVGPVDRKDPLARLNEVRATWNSMIGMTTDTAQPHIGFACLWDDPPERTWSYTPWNLRAALRPIAETTDIGVQIPRLSRTILKAGHIRYRNGRLTSTWGCSRLTDAYYSRVLRRKFARNPTARSCEAVLTMQVLAPTIGLPAPFFVYNDMSIDAWVSGVRSAEALAAIRSITPSTLARLRERELAVYERASGIFAMSHWCARTLIEQSDVPPEKVHVVHPAVSSGRALDDSNLARVLGNGQGEDGLHRQSRERAAPRRRLLFVGRQYITFDFYRKGGDLVVAALARLRRDYDSEITLTVVGPEQWPLPGALPDGIRFLGALPPADVTALYDSHDLFVMPSRIEPFGIVFAEALARGMPCIARDAYAMPEVVTPGVSGALVTKDDDEELAATIAAVLDDDALYEACHKRAPEVAAYFSWERAAWEVAQLISQQLRSAP